MARADLLLALVKSGISGDDRGFRRAAEAIIAEETAMQHTVLASQLTQALTQPRPGAATSPLARDSAAAALVFETEPQRRVADLVLPPAARQTVTGFIEEHHRRDLLARHGLEPRHRVLLTGPPGNGKTALAEAIATELAVPLLTPRYDALISSYLGETASRLDTIFAAVRTSPCVVFFDEFEAVAKERGDLHETGEIKRVVSSLLLQVDRLPSHVVVVAATNHAELLDRAVWRRMQLRIQLPRPAAAAKAEFLTAWSQRAGFDLGLPPATLAERLPGVSFAELEEFALDVRRRCILSGPEHQARDITRQVLRERPRSHAKAIA